MTPDLQRDLMAALERPHRLGTIGGDLEEQLAHCASFSSVLGQNLPRGLVERGIDLGTGGGLPGVALAALWPDMAWTLVDMRSARADEVERTILRLGFHPRVQVVAKEAQRLGHEPAHRELYDVAVARSFGPSSLTAECASGVLRVGGVLVVSEPPMTSPEEQEARWPGPGLTHLGLTLPRFHEIAGARFAVFDKVAAARSDIPRLPPRPTRGWLAS